LAKADQVVVSPNGVKVIGYTDLPARLPTQASQLFGTNLVNLLKLVTPAKDGEATLDMDDVVVRGMTVVHNGTLTWPPPPVQVSAAPAPVAAAPVVAKAATPPSPLRRYGGALVAAALLLLVGWKAPSEFLGHFTVFALAVVVGFYVIRNVHHALHTPLMSVTNAISGIIVVGALLQVGSGDTAATVIAVFAILLASINIFGGFLVTRRMLQMFRRADR
ncbi:MAG TPA: proton-translocating transhydrogenase family protein, partial [Candidatus Lustribacter sp.]|nr:proton-translocating transhydrogenase family protein [Candidatus Lustribacter sp.]